MLAASDISLHNGRHMPPFVGGNRIVIRRVCSLQRLFLQRLKSTFYLVTLFIIPLSVAACQPASPAAVSPSAVLPTLPPTPVNVGELAAVSTPDLSRMPLLEAHLRSLQTALAQPVPILLLPDAELNADQQRAQTLAVADQRFQQYLRDPDSGAALRNEIFGIYPMRDSDLNERTAACAGQNCYRVELYNYAYNFMVSASVDVTGGTVVDVVASVSTQPDIPAHLKAVALEIATQSTEVAQALGYAPDTQDAVMAETKTSLNGTRCERSEHLCVAPTFVSGSQALWAIVDLTDGRLVGVRWTWVGWTGSAATPAPGATEQPFITELQLQNDVIMQRYCEQNTTLERDGWRLDYVLTSSDGLRISGVTFAGQPVLESVKLVDWHVNYSNTDGFGYSDAVGCPVFSQAAVIAVQPPRVEDLVEDGALVGFVLVQDFWSELWPRPCNYYYQQRYEFYQDGRFRPIASSLGRGCGDDGTYRPVTRIQLADAAKFAAWQEDGWQIWPVEGWQADAQSGTSADGYSYRFTHPDGRGFYIEPGRGQFADGGRGDDAYVYVTRAHADRDEGQADMTTIGPCCNTDYQQGPEKFIDAEPEAITDAPLVIWYVAQIKNDDTPGAQYCWAESVLEDGVYVPETYPCPSGPMLVPVNPNA